MSQNYDISSIKVSRIKVSCRVIITTEAGVSLPCVLYIHACMNRVSSEEWMNPPLWSHHVGLHVHVHVHGSACMKQINDIDVYPCTSKPLIFFNLVFQLLLRMYIRVLTSMHIEIFSDYSITGSGTFSRRTMDTLSQSTSCKAWMSDLKLYSFQYVKN